MTGVPPHAEYRTTPPLTDHSQALANLLDVARRRHLTQLTVEQAVIATGAAFAGVVLLLLAGTQILDWYWLAVIFAGSFGIGLWRTWRRTPTRYRLAQIVDARLNLHDTLSTAFVYETTVRRADPDLVAWHSNQAAALARGVDAAAVFPLRMPKAVYAAGGAALVAFGMFAIRYGVTHSLDLKPSLVRIAFDTFWKQGVPPDQKPALQRTIEEQLKKLGINVNIPDAQPKSQDSRQESAMQTIDGPDIRNAEPGDNSQAKAEQVDQDNAANEGESGDKVERASGDPEQNPSGEPPNNTGAANEKNQPKDDKSNLLDKMKDAMANLLKKLNVNPKGGETKQAAQDSKSGSKGQQSQKGQQTQGKPDSNGSEVQDPQGDQKSQNEQAQNTPGKTGEKGGDKQPSSDSKSGIGKDDGDKSAKEAEQLKAMGKLSEILGKRAQNMSGELMVEVLGGNQQLKTAYSGATGKHAEAGGEINRDEVPLIYRDFVQQYFEQIRKSPPTGKKPDAAAQ